MSDIIDYNIDEGAAEIINDLDDVDQVIKVKIITAVIDANASVVGIPQGGYKNQVLAKNSNIDYDVIWKDVEASDSNLGVFEDIIFSASDFQQTESGSYILTIDHIEHTFTKAVIGFFGYIQDGKAIPIEYDYKIADNQDIIIEIQTTPFNGITRLIIGGGLLPVTPIRYVHTFNTVDWVLTDGTYVLTIDLDGTIWIDGKVYFGSLVDNTDVDVTTKVNGDILTIRSKVASSGFIYVI